MSTDEYYIGENLHNGVTRFSDKVWYIESHLTFKIPKHITLEKSLQVLQSFIDHVTQHISTVFTETKAISSEEWIQRKDERIGIADEEISMHTMLSYSLFAKNSLEENLTLVKAMAQGWTERIHEAYTPKPRIDSADPICP